MTVDNGMTHFRDEKGRYSCHLSCAVAQQQRLMDILSRIERAVKRWSDADKTWSITNGRSEDIRKELDEAKYDLHKLVSELREAWG